MKKNILLKTNLFICAVIIVGFVITSVISYYSNRGIFEQDVERVSKLTAEGIYHKIDSIFTKPINVSLTMANDSLLKRFLNEETQRLDDEAFIEEMRNYLLAYKEKYGYDSVFLVSTKTNRYYHFSGLDRILTPDNPENEWYYSFLELEEEYSLQIDNDEVEQANNEITVFINCEIEGPDGTVMGVVGVGFDVNYIQDLLLEYEEQFGVKAYLVDKNGTIQISTKETGFKRVNLFESCAYPELKDKILSNQEVQSLWYSSQMAKGYLVTQYVPNMEWYLIIDNNASPLEQKLSRQFWGGVIVVVVVIACVIFIITNIIRKFNRQIVGLTVAKGKEHQTIFQQATEQMYENIYEINITHNCAASEATEAYFESLGVPKNMPYDDALHCIAKKQIKEEFRRGYLDTFISSNVLKAYQEGVESLRYDFMISTDGNTYYWMRITARIFYWNDDESIRMFVYRQNIDMEKRQEKRMLEQMQKDSLSGLYNKAATQNRIRQDLAENPGGLYAFIILDIDNFKQVNDTFGHAIGDMVITDFSKILLEQFGKNDVVGRIGGDEFVAFLSAPSRSWVDEKAQSLVAALRHEFAYEDKTCRISSSIGIAISPDAGMDFETLYKNADAALYRTKERGKDGYSIY